jgi:CHASE2 domain-containing sensor protein/class 3 adenylate cyclase
MTDSPEPVVIHPLTSVIAVGLMTTAIVLCQLVGGLEPLELILYDRLLQLQSQLQTLDPSRESSTADRLLVVGINNQDLERYGWPLTDQILADSLHALQRHDPRVIGVDLYRNLPQPPGSSVLSQALKAPNIVGITDHGAGIAPPEALAADQVGFNDLVLDNDGVVRRSLLFVGTAEDAFYSFPLRISLQYLAQEPEPPQPIFELKSGDGLSIGSRYFPRLQPYSGGYDRLDNGGYQVLLHYSPSPIAQVSLSQVLSGQVDPALIRDRAVLMGTVDPTLKDLFRTPYSSGLRQNFLMPGVQLHWQITLQLLGETLDQHPSFHHAPWWGESLWILLWTIAGTGLGSQIRRPVLSGSGLLLGMGSLGAIGAALLWQGIWLPLVAPVVGAIGGWVMLLGYRAYQFQKHQQTVMRLLGQSTSPEIAQALWQQRDTLLKSGRLPGQHLLATILFADLAGFSTIAEDMEPEDLMNWLNECLDPITQLVRTHHGIVNKFTGDGFMAIFGLPMVRQPLEVKQDAQSAVSCAIAISHLLTTLNLHWQAKGLTPVKMRMGIFTGPVVAGSLGGRDRMEYGVLGDTVNTASRLESCEKDRMESHCRILIGQDTYDYLIEDSAFLESIVVEAWGERQLKGKSQLVNVYQVSSTPRLPLIL